jgi:hypothetical protein
MDLPVLVHPATLSWGKVALHEKTTIDQSLEIKNVSGQTQSISLAHVQAIPGHFGKAQIVPMQVDLAPFASRVVRVSLTPQLPTALGDFSDTEGDLLIAIAGRSDPLRVPMWARTMRAPARSGETVLLVDDDSGRRIEDPYMAALQKAGYTFVHWNVTSLDSYPTQQYMLNFPVVVWFMGSTSLNQPTAALSVEPFNRRIQFNVALTRYLARGGGLLLSGMDWSDQQELSVFGQQVLHIRQFDRDEFISVSSNGSILAEQTSFSITGVQGSPIAAGLSGFTANFDASITNYSDTFSVAATAIAKPALIANRKTNEVIAMTVETSSYRTVFCAFPLERLSSEGMNRVLSNSLDWLAAGESLSLSLLAIEPTVQSDNRLALPASLTVEGLSFFVGHDCFLDDIPVEIVAVEMPGTLKINVPRDLPPKRYSVTLRSPDGQESSLPAAFLVE